MNAPIESKYRETMNVLAMELDKIFNGDKKGNDCPTGFVLMVFPFGDLAEGNARCNYISNVADRKDVVALMKGNDSAV